MATIPRMRPVRNPVKGVRPVSPSARAVSPSYGARGTSYRLWRAKHAIEFGEKALKGQQDTMAVHEGRATSFLQWLSAEAIGAAAFLSIHHSPFWKIVGGVMLLTTVFAAGLAAAVFRPKALTLPGTDPGWFFLSQEDPAELTMLEALAETYSEGYQLNQQALQQAATSVRRAWLGFIGVPALTLITAVIVWAGKAA